MKAYLLLLLLFVFSFTKNQAQLPSGFANLDYPEIDSLVNLSYESGDNQTAILYGKAVKDKAKKDFGSMDSVYTYYTISLAIIYSEVQVFEEAKKLFSEAKKNFEYKDKIDTKEYAFLLSDLGLVYYDTKEYYTAEALFEKSINIFIKIDSLNPELLYPYNNLALLYHDFKDYDKAEFFYLKTKDIIQREYGEYDDEYLTCLNNLATLYDDIGNDKKAKLLYLEVCTKRKKILGSKNPLYLISLNNLADFYLKKGELEKSKNLYLGIQRIYKENPSFYFFHTQKNLINLGGNYYHLEKLDSAYFYFSEISTENPFILGAKYSSFLDVLHAQYQENPTAQKLQEYYQLAQTAIELNQRMKNEMTENKDKLQVLATNPVFVQHALNATLLLKDKGFIERAFSFAEQNKSILLADAIKGDRARNLGDLPDSLVHKEIGFKEDLTELKKGLLDAQTAQEKNEINSIIVELQLELDDFLKAIKNKYPKYHALKYQNITTTAKETQKILSEKDLFLEYFIVDSLVYLFAISKNDVELYPFKIENNKLSIEIKKLRQALTNYQDVINAPKKSYRNYTESALWLYNNLLKPALENQKNIKNLIIVTDGELGHLPFETFLTAPAAQNIDYKELPYLMNDYIISYNYSATLWKENINSPIPQNNQELLACAAEYKTIDSSLVTFRLPQEYTLRANLLPLDAAQEEVQKLSENFKGTFWFGKQCNETAFKKEIKDYSVLHLAMHGILNQKNPMLSSLAFTENGDSLDNNFLQAYEIARLQLNAEMVVLSACETGYGKFEQGEGIVSLARSFMYAGTPALVVSLWSVNDASTAIIMDYFYQNIADGMPKDEALRQAKLTYLQNIKGIGRHPAFWSPFIQLGNNKPVVLKTKSNYWIVGGGLGIFLLVIIGIMVFNKKEVA